MCAPRSCRGSPGSRRPVPVLPSRGSRARSSPGRALRCSGSLPHLQVVWGPRLRAQSITAALCLLPALGSLSGCQGTGIAGRSCHLAEGKCLVDVLVVAVPSCYPSSACEDTAAPNLQPTQKQGHLWGLLAVRGLWVKGLRSLFCDGSGATEFCV